MPALFLNLLKLIFLALLYLFLWQVARSIGAHLGTGRAPLRTRSGAEILVVKSESLAGSRFPLSGPLVLGRSADADIVVDDPYASDIHARVGLTNGEVMVHDLGSTNGTYVNGRRVTTAVRVGKGDAIQVGKTILEVR